MSEPTAAAGAREDEPEGDPGDDGAEDLRDPSAAADEYKADTRWEPSIWCGKVEESDEHIVCRGGTVVEKVRVVRRRPEGEQGSVDCAFASDTCGWRPGCA